MRKFWQKWTQDVSKDEKFYGGGKVNMKQIAHFTWQISNDVFYLQTATGTCFGSERCGSGRSIEETRIDGVHFLQRSFSLENQQLCQEKARCNEWNTTQHLLSLFLHF